MIYGERIHFSRNIRIKLFNSNFTCHLLSSVPSCVAKSWEAQWRAICHSKFTPLVKPSSVPLLIWRAIAGIISMNCLQRGSPALGDKNHTLITSYPRWLMQAYHPFQSTTLSGWWRSSLDLLHLVLFKQYLDSERFKLPTIKINHFVHLSIRVGMRWRRKYYTDW